jgi:hypothetical protein
VEHDPLGNCDLQKSVLEPSAGGGRAYDAFLRLIESRKLRQDSVVRVSHLGAMLGGFVGW